MSLDKAIKSGKEHRKPYYDSRDVSKVCRDGRCVHCLSNRLHNTRKREMKSKEELNERSTT